MTHPNTNSLVGEAYEIDPFYKFEFQGMTSGDRRYRRLIGFDSEGNHVFKVGREIQAWNERSAKMTQIRKEPA